MASAGGRCTRVAVFGGAITPRPANGLATIIEGKLATVISQGAPVVRQWAPVVTVEEAIAQGAARRDPDRDRLRRMAKALEAAGWPPPELVAQIGLETAHGMLEHAAAAKAMRQAAHDPARAAAAAKRDRDNAYAYGLQDAMARLERDGCGVCWSCQLGQGCVRL
jgi:hypothetical protein